MFFLSLGLFFDAALFCQNRQSVIRRNRRVDHVFMRDSWSVHLYSANPHHPSEKRHKLKSGSWRHVWRASSRRIRNVSAIWNRCWIRFCLHRRCRNWSMEISAQAHLQFRQQPQRQQQSLRKRRQPTFSDGDQQESYRLIATLRILILRRRVRSRSYPIWTRALLRQGWVDRKNDVYGQNCVNKDSFVYPFFWHWGLRSGLFFSNRRLTHQSYHLTLEYQQTTSTFWNPSSRHDRKLSAAASYRRYILCLKIKDFFRLAIQEYY